MDKTRLRAAEKLVNEEETSEPFARERREVNESGQRDPKETKKITAMRGVGHLRVSRLP